MTNLFENISDINIRKIKRFLMASTIKYPKGVNILSNVNKDDFIAIIDTGSVQFITTDYNGNKSIIEDISEGGMFSSLTFPIHNEEVSCITKDITEITYIEYNSITNDEIIKTDSYIIFIKNLIKIMSDQVSEKNDRIELLTKRTTRDKLVDYFKNEEKKRGTKTFTLPISFTELANYLSVDRSAMTREISYLKDDGLIKTNGRKITLLY